MPHVEQVIISEITRGDGKKELCRSVTQIHKLDGTFIAEHDPLPEFLDVEAAKVNGDAAPVKRTRRARKALEQATDPYKPVQDNRDDQPKDLDPVEQAQLALRNAQ